MEGSVRVAPPPCLAPPASPPPQRERGRIGLDRGFDQVQPPDEQSPDPSGDFMYRRGAVIDAGLPARLVSGVGRPAGGAALRGSSGLCHRFLRARQNRHQSTGVG
jgi:hypothetical protein